MKAAVVHACAPLRIGQGSAARPRAGTGEDRSLRRLPHRPACRRGRLAGEAAVAVHSRSRRRRLRRRGGQRSDPSEGRRPGRHPLAVHRLRLLRALPDRLGDLCESQQNTGYSVNGGYAEYVLADPNYVGILPKTSNSLKSRRSSAPASPSTRGSSRLTRAPASGWRSPASAASATSPCSTPGPWACTSPPSTSTTPSWNWRASSVPA